MYIACALERAARCLPEHTAIRFEGQDTSYRELEHSASRAASALRALGVARGDRVALLLPNIPAFAVAYHGAQKLGAIVVSLNSGLKAPEVQYILDDSGASVVITTAALREAVPVAQLARAIQVLIAEGETTAGDHALATLIEQASPEARAIDLEQNDPAAILYPSRTTGFPKGATLSHGNVISNVNATCHATRMTCDDRLLLFLPLFHCFGQNFIMNAAIAAGAQLVLHRRFVPDDALRALAADGVTMFFAVPTIFVALLNQRVPPEVFRTTRYHFSAAAPLPREIARRWQETYGQPLWEGYGLTETSPFASYNHELAHRLGSIGMPIENVEMKVVNEAGDTVAPGEWGEITIRGPNVMLGYWQRPEDTRKAIRDGWFHSGDVGTIDQDGYFFIHDRVDDMIITSGFNVYPAEVENALHGHPAVAEVAVYGVSDPGKGQLVAAAVVARAGAAPSGEELDTWCRERLANYKVPRQWRLVDALPKGATGKLLKRELRAQHPQ